MRKQRKSSQNVPLPELLTTIIVVLTLIAAVAQVKQVTTFFGGITRAWSSPNR